jgi:hypothetical protein
MLPSYFRTSDMISDRLQSDFRQTAKCWLNHSVGFNMPTVDKTTFYSYTSIRTLACDNLRVHSMSRITMLGLLVAFALVASGVCSPAELFGARPPVSAKDGESTLSHTVVPGGKSILTGTYVCDFDASVHDVEPHVAVAYVVTFHVFF